MANSLSAIRTDVATLSAEVRFMLQRVDPMLLDHEQRLRDLERRPELGNLPDRLRDVERWQWRRELPLALGSGGVAAVATAIITAMTGGPL
jgi:hypothetical protein